MQKRIENNREITKMKIGTLKRSIESTNLQLEQEKRREKIPLTKIRNEGGSITANITEINRAITESYE